MTRDSAEEAIVGREGRREGRKKTESGIGEVAAEREKAEKGGTPTTTKPPKASEGKRGVVVGESLYDDDDRFRLRHKTGDKGHNIRMSIY